MGVLNGCTNVDCGAVRGRGVREWGDNANVGGFAVLRISSACYALRLHVWTVGRYE